MLDDEAERRARLRGLRLGGPPTRIDPDGGALTEIQPRVATGGNPVTLVADRTGQHLFVGNWSDGTVSAYAVDAATGVPAEVPDSPFAANPAPHVHAVDASNRFLYVAHDASNLESHMIRVFAIAESGALDEVPGSPFTAGTNPIAIVSVP